MYIGLLIVCVLIFAVYASAYIGSGVYVKAQCRVKTTQRVVALTFDDGPDPVQTPKMLDVLRDNGVHALFFCVGSRAEQYPDIVKRIIDEGHIIGNHSYSHSYFFPLFGRKTMSMDIERCTVVLQGITGERVPYFRPPFGVTNPTIAYAVNRYGLKTIGWSIRSLDTLNSTNKKIINRVVGKLHNGAIILLHDNRQNSELLVLNLITELKKREYRIERLDRI